MSDGESPERVVSFVRNGGRLSSRQSSKHWKWSRSALSVFALDLRGNRSRMRGGRDFRRAPGRIWPKVSRIYDVQSRDYGGPSRRLMYCSGHATDQFRTTGAKYSERWTQQGVVSASASQRIGRVSYLIYVSLRHYVLTTSGDIVVCFHTAVCMSC